jgi:hypothetical protein
MRREATTRSVLIPLAVALLLSVLYVTIGLPAGPQSALNRADLVNKLITSLGLLAAGGWALYTFVLFRSAATSLDMSTAPEVRPFRSNLQMLTIDVTLRNTGKVVIEAGKPGCRVWLRRMPADAPPGPIDLNGGELLVDGFDLLSLYDKKYPYEIEPGSEYHEFFAMPVASGALLSILTTFYFGDEPDDGISERRLIFVD